ncbi:hypothetical protein [Robertmurraya korlensis]|nr:hypothetical protein [Robertmurraya korlensis]
MNSNEKQQNPLANTPIEQLKNKAEGKTESNNSAQKDGFRYDYYDSSDV